VEDWSKSPGAALLRVAVVPDPAKMAFHPVILGMQVNCSTYFGVKIGWDGKQAPRGEIRS